MIQSTVNCFCAWTNDSGLLTRDYGLGITDWSTSLAQDCYKQHRFDKILFSLGGWLVIQIHSHRLFAANAIFCVGRRGEWNNCTLLLPRYLPSLLNPRPSNNPANPLPFTWQSVAKSVLAEALRCCQTLVAANIWLHTAQHKLAFHWNIALLPELDTESWLCTALDQSSKQSRVCRQKSTSPLLHDGEIISWDPLQVH